MSSSPPVQLEVVVTRELQLQMSEHATINAVQPLVYTACAQCQG